MLKRIRYVKNWQKDPKKSALHNYHLKKSKREREKEEQSQV